MSLWALGGWEERFGVFRNDYEDFHLLQKLVWYLDRIDHPHVADAGIWEEVGPTEAVHLSSVGAVAAGLTQAARIGVKDIPERLLARHGRWRCSRWAGASRLTTTPISRC